MEALFNFLARVAYKRYMTIVALSGLLTLFCSYFVYQLVKRIETDIAALIPKDYPSVKTLEEIKSRIGGVGSLVVLVECEDYERSKRFAEDLAAELQSEVYAEYVNYVDYKADVGFFRDNALLYMDFEDLEEIQFRIEDRIAEEKLKLSPLHISLGDGEEELDFSDIEKKYEEERNGKDPFYSNPERTIVALEVLAAGTVSNIGFAKDMYDVIRGAVRKLNPSAYHPEMVVEYGGPFKNKIDEYEVILGDIKSTLVYGVVGVIVLLTFYFRQPLAVLFIAIPLTMSLMWAFAITYWIIGNLNTMTGFLFVILFGLGVDFGVHMFSRYLEDRMARMNVLVAIQTMLSQTGLAILTAALTTSMAFFSLAITDFKGFSEFGFIVGTGILMSLVSMMTVLPAFIVLADHRLNLIRLKPVWGHQRANGKGRFYYAGMILVAAVCITVYLASNLHKIEFEYDFTNLRSRLPASQAVKDKMSTIPRFNKLSQSPSVVLADSEEELDQIVSAIEAKIASDDPTPTIHTVRTLWSALPERQTDKLDVIEEIRTLVDGEGAKLIKGRQKERLDELRGLLDVTRLTVDDLPQIILRKFSTVDGSRAHFAFIYPDVPLRDGKKAMAFADDSAVIETASGETFFSSSSSVIFADMLRLMIRDSRAAIILTLLVVFLIVLADFRGLKEVSLVMLPLICGAIWMCGIVFLTGMKLNFYNMVALPTVIGMGIDNGVHFYHRYREEGPGSLTLVLRSTGGAMFVSTMTTIVGFLGLILATHPGLNSIGKLAFIGLCTCFISAVIVLPALLQVMENVRNWRVQAAYESVARSALQADD